MTNVWRSLAALSCVLASAACTGSTTPEAARPTVTPVPPAPQEAGTATGTKNGPPALPPNAGAAAATPPAARAGLEPAGPSLDWHTALEGDGILVELEDATSHYRVDSVELLGPGGLRVASGPLTREVERHYGYSSDGPVAGVGVGVFGGSSSGVGVSVGTGVPLRTRPYDTPPRTRTRTRIRLPDPAAYRAQASAYRIAVTLADSSGAAAFVELPAP